jgi:glycosyltransferase involved in cell wall biosynthesis
VKLLLVTDAWRPQTNGVVTTLTYVVRNLEALGIDVDVIEPSRFRTLPLPGYSEIPLALDAWRVGAMIDAARPDFVHVATEGPLGIAARGALLRRLIPYTTSFHTKFPEYLRARIGTPVSWGYAFMRWFHRPAHQTLVTTETQCRELRSWGFGRLQVWGRGVDTELFHPSLRNRTDDEPVLLYVGRVAVEKNLEAFLSLEVPGRKVVVGDGPSRKSLEARYPEAEFLGYRRGVELARCYADADVFVFPSRTDTFGLVMLEAMSCGTPVAAFPVTGPKDVVHRGVTGVLDEDLGKAVEGALALSRDACRAYAEAHSWPAISRAFVGELIRLEWRGERVASWEPMWRMPEFRALLERPLAAQEGPAAPDPDGAQAAARAA